MPTIYDLLPTLREELIKLIIELMQADNGALYTWEVTIFLPASNSFIHYLEGVNMSLQNDNYLSAMANLRGLIESLGAVVYDGTQKLSQEAYDEFIKNGRLQKWDEQKMKWINVGSRELARYTQNAMGKQVDIIKVYDHCCDMLHFSATHASFLGGFNSKVDESNRITDIKIGAKDMIPVQKQKEIIDLCIGLSTKLGQYIYAGIKEKNNRNTPKPQ